MTEISSTMILEGFVDVHDCLDEIYEIYLHGLPPGKDTGWPELNLFFRPELGQWTVVTGIPGTGKSTFVDSLLLNLTELHGWKHLICSPEHLPIARHAGTILGMNRHKQFTDASFTENDLLEASVWAQKSFGFIQPPEDDFTPDYVIDFAKSVEASGFKFDTLTIDPWNEMEHKRGDHFNETEYVSYALSKFRRYCRDYKKHLFLVAHPTKLQKFRKKNETAEENAKAQYPVVDLYDISGSAHFYNKCDNGISLWRDQNSTDNKVTVYVKKIRFRETGHIGECQLWHDWQTGRYESLMG